MNCGFTGTYVGVSHSPVGGSLQGALRCVRCVLRAGHPVCSLHSDQFATSFILVKLLFYIIYKI